MGIYNGILQLIEEKNMTNDYISRQDAVDAINANADGFEQNGGTPYAQGARAMAMVIEQLQPADVVEVKHGEWISECEPHYECSECHHWFHLYQYMNYCPNCGVRMDGGY